MKSEKGMVNMVKFHQEQFIYIFFKIFIPKVGLCWVKINNVILLWTEKGMVAVRNSCFFVRWVWPSDKSTRLLPTPLPLLG